MLLQLKLATKGFVSQHDEEEIDFVKGSDLDELDDDEELDEEEEQEEKRTSETEPDEESNEEADYTEIFKEKDEIGYSSDFFC